MSTRASVYDANYESIEKSRVGRPPVGWYGLSCVIVFIASAVAAVASEINTLKKWHRPRLSSDRPTDRADERDRKGRNGRCSCSPASSHFAPSSTVSCRRPPPAVAYGIDPSQLLPPPAAERIVSPRGSAPLTRPFVFVRDHPTGNSSFLLLLLESSRCSFHFISYSSLFVFDI